MRLLFGLREHFSYRKTLEKSKQKQIRSQLPSEWQELIAAAGFTIEREHGDGVHDNTYFHISRQGLLLCLINYSGNSWCEVGWKERPGMWPVYRYVLKHMHISRHNIPNDYGQMIHYILGPENAEVLEQLVSMIAENRFVDIARGVAGMVRKETDTFGVRWL